MMDLTTRQGQSVAKRIGPFGLGPSPDNRFFPTPPAPGAR